METVRTDRSALIFTRLPVYYGWVNLSVAALAMVGTLPGRTQGLGLITEPMLRDTGIDRVEFAQINLWATLIGSLFCIGIGRLIDRVGSRTVLTGVAFALGVVVLLMSGSSGLLALALLITLTRGFGQSALSVVSLTIVGQWFVFDPVIKHADEDVRDPVSRLIPSLNMRTRTSAFRLTLPASTERGISP